MLSLFCVRVNINSHNHFNRNGYPALLSGRPLGHRCYAFLDSAFIIGAPIKPFNYANTANGAIGLNHKLNVNSSKALNFRWLNIIGGVK